MKVWAVIELGIPYEASDRAIALFSTWGLANKYCQAHNKYSRYQAYDVEEMGVDDPWEEPLPPLVLHGPDTELEARMDYAMNAIMALAMEDLLK